MGWVSDIGIGIVGGGYMGKAHAVAMSAVAAVFDTALRPRLEIICTTTPEGAAEKARQFGFARATDDWRQLVTDPRVDAVVIASPQDTHKAITLAALAAIKHVFCEKPLGLGSAESRVMLEAAQRSGLVHMTGFNYIRTPASQLARQIIAAGEIGKVTSGGFGPTVGGPIAMGYVERAQSANGTKVELLVRGKPVPAEIVPMPFVKHTYYRG